MNNYELDCLNIKFIEYLNKQNFKNEIIEKIIPKSCIEVIKDMGNPLKENGYHPAFKLYFIQFIDYYKNNINYGN